MRLENGLDNSNDTDNLGARDVDVSVSIRAFQDCDRYGRRDHDQAKTRSSHSQHGEILPFGMRFGKKSSLTMPRMYVSTIPIITESVPL